MVQRNECDQLWDLLSAYADGDVSTIERELIQTHIRHCKSCAEYVEFVQSSKALFLEAPRTIVPVDLKYSILAATVNQRVKINFWQKYFVPARVQVLSFAGAVAILIVMASLTGNSPMYPNSVAQKVSKDDMSVASAAEPDQTLLNMTIWDRVNANTSQDRANSGQTDSAPVASHYNSETFPNNRVQSASLVERTGPIIPMSVSNRRYDLISMEPRPETSATTSRIAPRQVNEDKSLEPHGIMELASKPVPAPQHTENPVPVKPVENPVHHVDAVTSVPHDEGHTILTASSSSTDSMDSLASLRTTLRKDEAIAAGEQLRLVPNKVLWDVYKSRF